MQPAEMSVGELADAAGLTRRAIRFYVQQGLLPAPLGRGRGSHYNASHLEQLRRLGELQAAGHSLDAIRKILAGGAAPAAAGPVATPVAPPAAPPPPRRAVRAALSAELWTRLGLMEGVELHFDAARFNPPVERLLEVREAVRNAFGMRAASGHRAAEDDGSSNGGESNNGESNNNTDGSGSQPRRGERL